MGHDPSHGMLNFGVPDANQPVPFLEHFGTFWTNQKRFFFVLRRLVDDTKKSIIMQTENLKLLRSLRAQEKAIKARIDEISPKAADEAVAILATKGQDRGEFEVEGVGTFQLQHTDVFNLADYNKYKGEEAVNWRLEAKKKIKAQNAAKACTASMAGFLKTFVELNPDKKPDEIKLTVKVID